MSEGVPCCEPAALLPQCRKVGGSREGCKPKRPEVLACCRDADQHAFVCQLVCAFCTRCCGYV
eukprot:697857-Amphidinium_carterae.1